MQLSSEAYAPDGTLWWQLKTWPGKTRKLGDEIKIAAWLASTKFVGEQFTTEDIRIALGDGLEKNDKEHLQRRLRELRNRDGWAIPSKKYDRTLPLGHYRLDFVGWHPHLGPRPKRTGGVSAKTKRIVIDRDGRRCQVCGIGANEPYPDRPNKVAVLTAGHITPGSFKGADDLSNLQAECSLCNEAIRSDTGRPETYEEVIGEFRLLKKTELERIHSWTAQGHRTRDKADAAYDRFRMLSPGDKIKIEAELKKMLGH